MAVTKESSQSATAGTNGSAESERLAAQVLQLQEECRKLRNALTQAEAERESFRQLFLQEARERREFEDLDIPTLERMSAGPVEKL